MGLIHKSKLILTFSFLDFFKNYYYFVEKYCAFI